MAEAFGWERELLDKIAIHQYQNGLMEDVSRMLAKTMRTIVARLAEQSLSWSDQVRLVRTLNSIGPLIAGPYDTLRRQFEREVAKLAELQAEVVAARLTAAYSGTALEAGVIVLTPAQVASIVAFPVQGLGIGEWWEREAAAIAARVKLTIQQGLMQGLSSADIARQIAKQQTATKGANAYRMARGRANGLVRTVTSAITSHTDVASFRAQGTEITDRYVFRATMDQRTSPVCIANDGRVFAYDAPDAPVPPLHMLCRSTIIPLLNTKGMRPAVRQKLIDAGLATGPGARPMTKYAEWLRGQDETVQNRVLGKTRATMFRGGKITLADLVNTDGKTLTLAQLRQRMK